jgi:hypothetical protein
MRHQKHKETCRVRLAHPRKSITNKFLFQSALSIFALDGCSFQLTLFGARSAPYKIAGGEL